ncbi:MAG: hypothetical protein QG656_2751, partial [Candidatus Hydrogenedentes bacterium]|nr:hypothetical protein [Candidatus Hydrogenedentota bacterium]
GFCVVFVVLGVYTFATYEPPAGPSELALHPERQDEIKADRRAQELQQTLSLNDDQTAQVSAIILAARKENAAIQQQPFEVHSEKDDAILDVWIRAVHQIDGLLTPEQLKRYLQEDDRKRLETVIQMRNMIQVINPDRDPRQFLKMINENSTALVPNPSANPNPAPAQPAP